MAITFSDTKTLQTPVSYNRVELTKRIQIDANDTTPVKYIRAQVRYMLDDVEVDAAWIEFTGTDFLALCTSMAAEGEDLYAHIRRVLYERLEIKLAETPQEQ